MDKGDGRLPNTILFHTVMKFYGDLDSALQPRGSMQDRFQAAAFEEYYSHGTGFHANEFDSCLKAARRAGLDHESLQKFLMDQAALRSTKDSVREEIHRTNIDGGIPYFVVNGRPAFSGAQDVSAFVQAFNRS